MTVAILSRPSTADGLVSPSLGDGPLAAATRGLAKRYGRNAALDGVDLQVPEGSVYVLAGPNGAGKSTLLKILMNLVRADAGGATVLGLDPRRCGPEVRSRVGYVPEGTEAGYRWMSVGRLLEHHAAYYPSWDRDYAQRLSKLLDVRPERRIGAMSKGQTRRVQLTLALAQRPSLLVLDEPTDGLDPVARDDVMGLLSEHMADTGCTLIISTHLVYEADRLADHVGVLRDGRLVAQTSRERLHAGLRLYRMEGPDGWVGPTDLSGVLVRRSGVGREVQWTAWGDETEMVARINRSGGVVRDVSPLSLDQAVLTLLRAREPS